MAAKNADRTREVVISYIESKFSSDAQFERELNLVPKTVNNWRRGRSASFMKMLPELAELFGVSVNQLADPDGAARELSTDEQELLTVYRHAGQLTPDERAALNMTLRSTIELYISSRRGSEE